MGTELKSHVRSKRGLGRDVHGQCLWLPWPARVTPVPWAVRVMPVSSVCDAVWRLWSVRVMPVARACDARGQRVWCPWPVCVMPVSSACDAREQCVWCRGQHVWCPWSACVMRVVSVGEHWSSLTLIFSKTIWYKVTLGGLGEPGRGTTLCSSWGIQGWERSVEAGNQKMNSTLLSQNGVFLEVLHHHSSLVVIPFSRQGFLI